MEELKKNFKREIKTMIYTEISNNRKHLFKKIENQINEIFKKYKKKLKQENKNISIKEEINNIDESNINSIKKSLKFSIKKEKLFYFINKKIDEYLLPRENFLNDEFEIKKINSKIKKKNKESEENKK
jgi:hypothetical protein